MSTWDDLEAKYSQGAETVTPAAPSNDPWAALEAKHSAVSSPAFVAPVATERTPNPTDGQSGFQNFAAGMGGKFVDLGLGAKQRLDEGAAFLEKKFGGPASVIGNIGKSLGMPTAESAKKETQAKVIEKRAIDKPLLETTGGKAGGFAGAVVPAVATMFIPGAQTLTGSILTGGGLGALETTVPGESTLKNIGLGGAGGAAGYGLSKAVGMGVNKLAERGANKAAANVLVDANTNLAREAGYAIPVSQSNPSSLIANSLDIVAGGRPKMAQAASLKNQPVTNRLAAKAIGLPEDAPITLSAIDQVRKAAHATGYQPISSAGTITPGPAYEAALDSIVKSTKSAANSFPGAVKNDIPALIDNLRVKQFDAGDALQMTQVLRDGASVAYRNGDSALGKANKQAAAALEDAIDDHLSATGATEALKNFRDARKLMAKTFTVEKALNNETGDISAQRIATELAKGKPLSDELLSIGKMGRLSPKNVQSMQYATPAASQLESVSSTAASIAAGNPLPMAIPYARAGLRGALLSGPVQKMAGKPNYGLLSKMSAKQLQQLEMGLLRSGVPLGAASPGLLDFAE